MSYFTGKCIFKFQNSKFVGNEANIVSGISALMTSEQIPFEISNSLFLNNIAQSNTLYF